jgi:hypothetical protein
MCSRLIDFEKKPLNIWQPFRVFKHCNDPQFNAAHSIQLAYRQQHALDFANSAEAAEE